MWEKILSNHSLTDMLDAWYKIIKEAGFIPGIYLNRSLYKEVYDETDSENNKYLDKFENWVAGTINYSEPCHYEDFSDPGSSTSYQDLNINCNMRQVSEACVGIGAGNEDGYVDFNYCYTDYENVDLKYDKSFDIKGLDRKSLKEIFANSFGALLIVSGGVLFIYKKNKKAKENYNMKRSQRTR